MLQLILFNLAYNEFPIELLLLWYDTLFGVPAYCDEGDRRGVVREGVNGLEEAGRAGVVGLELAGRAI